MQHAQQVDCRAGSIEEALAELDMDHYDDDELGGGDGSGGRPFGAGPPGMSYYRCGRHKWR